MQGKVSSNDSAMDQVYVGIDVCKKWLDFAIHPVGHAERFENAAKGHKRLLRHLQSYPVALVVLEATGKLHRQANRPLHAAGYPVAVVNPLRARLFAEAAGKLAKTDPIDARTLAVMGESLKLAANPPPAARIAELQELVLARRAAVTEKTALENRKASCESRSSPPNSPGASPRCAPTSSSSKPRSAGSSPPIPLSPAASR
jgi:transposase